MRCLQHIFATLLLIAISSTTLQAKTCKEKGEVACTYISNNEAKNYCCPTKKQCSAIPGICKGDIGDKPNCNGWVDWAYEKVFGAYCTIKPPG